jgi:16S rRNA (cytidine1402-2'-O)-methyltransferase
MGDSKRQDLPAGLWVVATPIGNLGDLSPRARAALEMADALLCEDTRTTQALLNALGIRREGGTLLRLDAHAEKRGLEQAIGRLQDGESLALVSDAGTPGLSDPGARLVARAREEGVRVLPVPGPSAVAALVSILGTTEVSFTFRGFFPRKASEREAELELVSGSAVSRVFVWFESPHRVAEALEFAASKLPGARALVAKEMTKLHERYAWGTLSEAAQSVSREVGEQGEKGEWCFALVLPELEERESSDWVKALQCLLDAPVSASVAAQLVSQHFGVSKRLAYDRSLELSGKKNR